MRRQIILGAALLALGVALGRASTAPAGPAIDDASIGPYQRHVLIVTASYTGRETNYAWLDKLAPYDREQVYHVDQEIADLCERFDEPRSCGL